MNFVQNEGIYLNHLWDIPDFEGIILTSAHDELAVKSATEIKRISFMNLESI